MDYVRLTDDNRLEQAPETLRDETMAFVDNFRQAQGERATQLGESAHALGSDLTAPYGGLHGPSEYMKSRYQAPQTDSRLAALRTSAQLDALNKLMQNDLARYQEQASQAYRNALKNAKTTPTTTTDSDDGGVVYDTMEDQGTAGTLEAGLAQAYDTESGQLTNTTVIAPEGVDENGNARYVTIDNATGQVVDSADGNYANNSTKQAAADAWAARAGYGSWAGYVAKYTDENGKFNPPSGKPSSVSQFNTERYALGY